MKELTEEQKKHYYEMGKRVQKEETRLTINALWSTVVAFGCVILYLLLYLTHN